MPVAAGPAAVAIAERFILLPADAGFQYLPTQAAWAAALAGGAVAVPHIVGLVPTHHGARSWMPIGAAAGAAAASHIPGRPGHALANSPTAGAAAANKVAYSYGTRLNGPHVLQHPYGHPHPAAVAAYNAHGWGNPETLVPALVPSVFYRINTAQEDYCTALGRRYDPLNLHGGAAVAAGVVLPIARFAGHLNTNIALGWITGAVQSPLTGDLLPAGIAAQPAFGVSEAPIRRTCGVCMLNTDYYY